MDERILVNSFNLTTAYLETIILQKIHLEFSQTTNSFHFLRMFSARIMPFTQKQNENLFFMGQYCLDGCILCILVYLDPAGLCRPLLWKCHYGCGKYLINKVEDLQIICHGVLGQLVLTLCNTFLPHAFVTPNNAEPSLWKTNFAFCIGDSMAENANLSTLTQPL